MPTSLEEQKRRGQQAKRIAEDPYFKDHMESIRQDAIKWMSETDVRDDEGRRIARIMLMAVTTIEKRLRHDTQTSLMADMQLQMAEAQHAERQRKELEPARQNLHHEA